MTPKQVFISWDIDGTLLLGPENNQTHINSFRGAIAEVTTPFSSPIEEFLGHSVNGYMDSGIVAELFQKLGVEVTPEIAIRAQKRTEELYREAAPIPTACEGIPDILEFLATRPNVTMGLASGNFPDVAWYKLEAVGLLKYFPDRIAGLGTMADRKDAILTAVAAAEKLKGGTFDVKIHVGDTPADSDAAIRAGVIPFLVRTGRHVFPDWPTDVTTVDNLRVGGEQFLSIIGIE
jgi:phosphoglycolate phosphatase-like HAD superfamily hydrolase